MLDMSNIQSKESLMGRPQDLDAHQGIENDKNASKDIDSQLN